jgi:hypothetical protein
MPPRRPFDYRSRQASADQELRNNLQERPRLYQGYYEPRDIDGYEPAPPPMSMSMLPQLQTPLQPGIGPGLQHAVGSMPMWLLAPQNYHPALNHMQRFNGVGPSYGVNSSLAMANANFQTPPHQHHHLTDFSHLMVQPPQRNNTPEPAITTNNNNQQLPVHPTQMPPQIPFASHPSPATLQTSQHPRVSSTSHPGLYMNGPTTQQVTSQLAPQNYQPQQEAGPSTHPGQPIVQTLQHAPNYSVPSNQQPQQETYPPTHQAMAQTPQYAPLNYPMPLLPMATYSYALPGNSNGATGQPARPIGRRSRYQDAPGPPQMSWSGRGGFGRR